MQRTSIVSGEQPTRCGSLRQRRVLHVEADPLVAALVEATLEDNAIEVHWAPTGRSAITAACAYEYDAYLLGIDARDMGPVALAEELARLDGRVPVILIADGPKNLPLSLNLTVVRRPFAPGMLLGAVETALDAYRDPA